MTTALFWTLFAAANLLPLWFVRTIWRERVAYGANWITKDGRTMYVDAAKGLAALSGVAVSIVVSLGAAPGGTRDASVSTLRKVAVVYLIISHVAAMLTVVALCRCYDRARTRLFHDTKAGKEPQYPDSDQGKLNDSELGWILIFAALALIGFLAGFLFLGRMSFHM